MFSVQAKLNLFMSDLLFGYAPVYISQSRLFETHIFLYIVMRAFFIFFYFLSWKQHLPQISSKVSLLDFNFSKLWFVIPQFSQTRPARDVFLVFSNTFKNKIRQNKLVGLFIFFSRNHPSTLDMLKNELITVQRRIQEY